MPSSFDAADRAPPTVVTNGTPPLRASRLPSRLRVPILIVLNWGVQNALWSVAENFLDPELGAITRTENEWWSPYARLGYKVLIIFLGWYLRYDYIDVASLNVLTHVPFAYLLSTYYNVSHTYIGAFIGIEMLSIVIPTFLLRPRSVAHNPNVPIRNRYLLNSFQVQWANIFLAIGVYSIVIWGALKSQFLSPYLVQHFDIPTVEASHNETPLTLAAKIFVIGFAAKAFILNPSFAAQPASGAATPTQEFDPATATLPETVKHNVWFFSRRTRTLIRQTTILNAFLFANTVQRCLTLQSSDFAGAAGYAGLWIFANVIVAGWWVWVGDTSEED